MILVLIIIGIILMIVILLLPKSIIDKMSGAAVALGILLTGYGLYLTSQVQKREIFEKDIVRVTDVWSKYYNAILESPDSWPIFEEVHGHSVPAATHIMFSQIAQLAEELVRREEMGLLPIDKTWKNTLIKWTKHPDWNAFWIESRDEYTDATRDFIENLMKQNRNPQ